MKKLKHTPGPWGYDYDLDCRDIRTDKNDFIAGLEFMNSDDETNANGLLIAAAPEMLEALIEARKRYQEREDMSTIWIQDISKLIEKATGMSIEEIMEKK